MNQLNYKEVADEFIRINNLESDGIVENPIEFSEKLSIFLSEKTGKTFWGSEVLRNDMEYFGSSFQEDKLTPEKISRLKTSTINRVDVSVGIMSAIYCGDRAAIDKYVGQIMAEIAA